MPRFLALALALAAIPACTLLEPAAERIGAAVHRYCREPATTRQAWEAQVNKAAAPNAVRVDCVAPPPAPSSSG